MDGKVFPVQFVTKSMYFQYLNEARLTQSSLRKLCNCYDRPAQFVTTEYLSSFHFNYLDAK